MSIEGFRCAITSRDPLPDIELLKIKIVEANESNIAQTRENESSAFFAKNRYSKHVSRGSKSNWTPKQSVKKNLKRSKTSQNTSATIAKSLDARL